MADRVHPSSVKPPTTTAATTTPAFPATKAQIYGASRPTYRPQSTRHRSRRSCCRSICICTVFIIITLIIAIAIAGTVVYLVYRPHRPTFSVSGLTVSSLNLTSSSRLITSINLNVTTRNPNKKIIYIYNPTTISVLTDDGVEIGTGLIPAFSHGTKNTTLLKTSIGSDAQQVVDNESAGKLRSDLKSKNGVDLKIKLDTKVKVKMGGLKAPKVRIRVSCKGIKVNAPTGKAETKGSINGAKCNVDLRFKIWKWTF